MVSGHCSILIDSLQTFDTLIMGSEETSMPLLFKRLAANLAIVIPVIASQASSEELPPKTLDVILDAGGWTSTADDTNQRERLPLSLVRQLIKSYPSDNRSIGLLSITLGTAKWGVDGDSTLPDDPANDTWRGPTRFSGKHLMSYNVGGVGLPHLDVGPLANFIDFLLAQHPNIGDDDERSHMKQIASNLRNGQKFDQIKSNATFRKWMREGLRRKDAQKWILEYWLDTYWEPSYRASAGDIRLALVVARIWNTSPRLGKCAAERALKEDDHVQAALKAYVHCPGGRKAYESRRWGWMKRAVTLFDAYTGKSP